MLLPWGPCSNQSTWRRPPSPALKDAVQLHLGAQHHFLEDCTGVNPAVSEVRFFKISSIRAEKARALSIVGNKKRSVNILVVKRGYLRPSFRPDVDVIPGQDR